MRKYLAYGCGVNSTALLIFLRQQGIDFEPIFADHGGYYPETYEYIKMLNSKGYDITLLDTRRNGLTLPEDYERSKTIPTKFHRWCTADFKVNPMRKYYQLPCVLYIG